MKFNEFLFKIKKNIILSFVHFKKWVYNAMKYFIIQQNINDDYINYSYNFYVIYFVMSNFIV